MKNSSQVTLSFFLSMICTALIMLVMNSCEQNPTVTLSRDEFNRLSNASVPEPFSFSPNSFEAKNYHWQVIKGSDGHEYIECTGKLFILHSPECKLCKSQQKFYLLDDDHNQNDTIK